MTAVDRATIRSLFMTRRPIDRPIEKVIDYYAVEPQRLRAEIEEYEVTANVEQNFRRFLDHFGHGVRTGQVTETGIWVSGFYGSGKSSFTKYLGFALDPSKIVEGRPFLELLAERINAADVSQDLKTLATRHPAAVIMLDLGSEQLASSATTSVSTVLYWKVLQWAGYSKEEKIAQLECRLEKDGRFDAFKRAYAERFGGKWEEIHNDPLSAVPRADLLVPQFYPDDFPAPGAFSRLRFSLAGDVRDRAAEIIDLVHRRTGRENILFLIDEAGQYVAPRGELILNLDGLARSFKELGRGRVWIVATGQQTLSEIVERAAYNSAELFKLRDRFPIPIELAASDIREITRRRLLQKSANAESTLGALFRQHGQSLIANTRLTSTALFKADPDERAFVSLYPFLPQHFDLLLVLISALARGSVGLRSAIRVIQDLLVDASKVLPPGTLLLADSPVGRMATADQFFDTLRADIAKSLPHVVVGVDRVAKIFPDDDLVLRAAKAVAALQAVENFPTTVENVAALLYSRVGDPPHVDAVRAALRKLLDEKEVGLIDDPQSGGFAFLSEKVRPLREKRDRYVPTRGEVSQLRSKVLQSLFEQLPSATIEEAKTVQAGVFFGSVPIVGEDKKDVRFRIETADGAAWDQRRTALLAETTGSGEWKAAIAWLIRPDEAIEDALVEAIKSRVGIRDLSEADADRDVAQFIRAERRAAETNEDTARKLYRQALLDGTLIFRGNPTPAQLAGNTIDVTANRVLRDAAAQIYSSFYLVNIRPATDLAAKFLAVELLNHMPRELDPLRFVTVKASHPTIDTAHPALAEALRAFRKKLDDSNTPRLQGSVVQDLFAMPPYGWSKDATRYVFAALLVAREIVAHTAGGPVRAAGPTAVEAFKSTLSFNRVGVSLRDAGDRATTEQLELAASRLEDLFGETVLPLEDQISRAVREHLPARLEQIASLPARLDLLGLAGAARASAVLDTGRDLIQQDGTGATAVLGASDCAFPADLRWAQDATQALANGAGSDVRVARETMAEADDLVRFFPSATADIVADEERETLADVLASETFYACLADLRGVLRAIRDRAASRYGQELAGYRSDLDRARDRLEERPAWLKVADEDRAYLAGQLRLDLPELPAPGEELAQLRAVLFRRTTLPGLEAELAQELLLRVPPPPPDQPTEVDVDVDITDFLPREPLKDAAALTAWLESLRVQLEAALVPDKPLRLRIGR